MTSIREANRGADDRALVTDIITRAFADDPLLNWIALQDRHRLKRIRRLVQTTVELYMPEGKICIETERRGCALWIMPGYSALSPRQTLRIISMLGAVAGFRRLPEMLDFYRNFERLAPEQPAFHLFYLAVVPEARMQGIASALLKPALDQCDAGGMPAYLENSNSANLKFYERHGFRLTRKWRLREKTPAIWCMFREPK